MKIVSKGWVLSVLCLVGHYAAAASPSPIDTITCTRSDGSTLKHNVYAFTLGANALGSQYFTVYFSDSLLLTFINEEFFGSGYSYCTFGKLTQISLNSVNIVDVAAAGVGANVGTVSIQEDSVSQSYAEITFQYNNISFGTDTKTSTFPVGSKEEQAKALAAFKARGLALPK